MKNKIKKLLKLFIPKFLHAFIGKSIPQFNKLNTYFLKIHKPIKYLAPIDHKYFIRVANFADIERLKLAEAHRNPKKFDNKIPPRLKSDAWHGLAVFDRTNDEIAYIAWVIGKTIPYFEEFGIKMKKNQFLLKDGFCVPKYRHQGLHTRMEQERINFCVRNGGNEIFIQIHASNKKGIASVLNNGYTFFRQDYVIIWPIFNIYRSLKGFLINPFRKVLK